MRVNRPTGSFGAVPGVLLIVFFLLPVPCSMAAVSQLPLFLTQGVPPLNLLVMGRDHKLYYEAYNDASDLDGDGTLDVGYKPDLIDYYGYFDSFKCYTYDNSSSVFNPTSISADKTCSGSLEWSGDFLNYLTTSRMDALRKVLYGGKRSTDSTSATILERSHVPQDAHSWGKEYASVAADGYDIRDYSPLDLPQAGYRHLFANTTLGAASASSNPGPPLLRVLNDSRYRIWEWVSIERPVAGSKCLDGGSGPSCETTGGTVWEVVPASAFQNLSQSTYDLSGIGVHPDNHTAYDTLIANRGVDIYRDGTGPASTIDGSGNPFGADDYYLNLFSGDLVIPADGTYTFAVDGDDALELIIDGTLVASWYGGHGNCGCQDHSGSIYLTAGTHTIEFRHEELTGSDSYTLYWQRTVPASAMTDYTVRVSVCEPGLLEANCRQYPNGGFKPTGLLQKYGENDSMKFGLLTGSYAKNISGGVLRKTVDSFSDEIDPATGRFTSTVGVVRTIDRLRTVGFGSNHTYNANCGWIATRAISEGECRMWGNPVAEMMFEGLRYFSGCGGPSSAFGIASSGNDDADLGLPLASWDDPYASGSNEPCAKAFQLVISDINPSYDTDQLPGTAFGSYTTDGSDTAVVKGLAIDAMADRIWGHEYGGSKEIFIGQVGSDDDGAPTAKTAQSFDNIRGLAPEEPTKKGGYYGAGVALYGQTSDLHTANGDQKMTTFSVALASPLPQIDIEVGGRTVTLVPFAKSVAGYSISAVQGAFQPTNTIVDFYVEELSPTYGRFRINFEDVEQGADHDMDAIAEYTYQVNPDNTLSVSVNSIYAAGSITQHMGYVISGTSADGVYLEVRDCDTANASGSGNCSGNNPSSDPDYFLDTPPGQGPNGVWADGLPLPLSATRIFTPSGSGSDAEFLRDPLWYAAKYGKFEDKNGNGLPDLDASDPDKDEFEADAEGNPANYFLVTNALTLNDQLEDAFSEILKSTASAAAIATNSTRLDTDTLIYQAKFDSEEWTGQLLAYPVNMDGSVDGQYAWDASSLLPHHSVRKIFTLNPAATPHGVAFLWTNLNATQQGFLDLDAGGASDGLGAERVAYLRGDQSLETDMGGTFRSRSSLLGDIVNSDPFFVGTPNFGYESLSGTEGTSYLAFRESAAYTSRSPMVYVGANDGMLHGFHAENGSEKFAYLPGMLMPGLSRLTDPDYAHRYYVDGSPRVGDAYLDLGDGYGPQWRSVLVGSLGAGGRGIFALDVSDPDNFSAADVLWEFTHADLGHTIGQPTIARLESGDWVAIFGNGYESASGKGVLFIVDLADGSLLKAIDVEIGGNGMSTPVPVDVDGDRITEHVYAGDLQGNLWKFDLSATNLNSWASAFKSGNTPMPLFTGRDASGNVQPITARPAVGRHPELAGGIMVYFGTGKYYGTTDNVVPSPPPVMSFYGIADTGSSISTTDRSELQGQTILKETTAFGEDLRVVSDTAVDWTVKKGWYLDLVSPSNVKQGERVVSPALLRHGRVIFTTLIPSGSPCDYGGTGWLMEIQAASGARLDYSVFDLNGDDLFNSDEFVTVDIGGQSVTVPVSGKKSKVGIIKTPGVISAGSTEYKYTTGTTGDIGVTKERGGGLSGSGRKSWREVR